MKDLQRDQRARSRKSHLSSDPASYKRLSLQTIKMKEFKNAAGIFSASVCLD
jgi:hypothetical protein